MIIARQMCVKNYCKNNLNKMNSPLETLTSVTDDDECSENDDVADDSEDDERRLLRSCELRF